MTNYHLAILKKPYLDLILAGTKKIESRFTKTKRSPFDKIAPGDKIFLKVSSGPVCATAAVEKVQFFENLSPDQILNLKQKYNHQILAGSQYWQSKFNCTFGVLIWLKDVRPTEPIRIPKNDWRAWVMLTKERDYGLLKECKECDKIVQKSE